MYSRTWMKSITMVTCRVRAWASAVIRSIWWLLPSTRATQVRAWSGSRRSASAKIWATTDAASATTLAVSHLFDVTGPGSDLGAFGVVRGQDVRAGARGGGGVEHGSDFGHPFPVALLSLREPGRQLRAGLGGRGGGGRAQRVGAHHDALAVAGQHEWVAAGAGRGLPPAVEAVGVDGGSAGELFDLPFADLLSGAPFDRLDRPVERPT